MSADLEQHRQAYSYCAYCPKVCRFSCPVSESTKSESVSTWGKMTAAFLTTQRGRPLEEGGAKALYACTGCMRCRSFCKHENEVGFALFSARQLAVDKHLAPKEATSTLETFAEHQNPFGKDLNEVVGRYHPDAPVRYQLFPGCTALAKAPEAIDDAIFVGEKLSAPFGVCRAGARCCGYPLYAAGDLEAFKSYAAQFAKTLSPYPELIVLDPGCAYTLKVVYPRAGVLVPSAVRTVYEVLAEHLEHAPERPPLNEKVAYQDACHLGRGLGQYEQPRKLLEAAVGPFGEAFDPREEAGCSGGGGLLPRTMPDVSVDIARREAERVAEAGEQVVTACPTSRRMIARAGRPSADLLSILRRWLGGGGEPTR